MSNHPPVAKVGLKGYVNGALLYDSTYTLSATTPTYIPINFLGVTAVDFISSGGTAHSGYGGAGEHFVMDNLLVVESSGSGFNTVPFIYTFGPPSAEVSQGQSTNLLVAAVGQSPLTYQWQLDGASLPGQTNTTLNLSNLQPAMAGSYSVVVANNYGSVTSPDAIVTVVSAPLVTVPPQNQYTALGGNATFTVTALGAPPLSYQWQFSGSNVSGATASSETIRAVTAANAGSYDVVVSNAYGWVTSMTAQLYVGTAPVILTTFSNQTAILGNSLTLSVSASGSGPLTYHWLQNGVSLGGDITTFAGDGSLGFFGDGGQATSASLYFPAAVAVDGSGNVLIADTDNGRIRKVGASNVITTVAGNGNYGYSGDGGQATNASLYDPSGVAASSSGVFYIADTENQRIRKVAANGIITTVAGNGSTGYGGDGVLATTTSLDYPSSVAVDAAGNLYIADTDNSRIRKVAPNGLITTVAGDGDYSYYGDGGLATNASLDYPNAVAVDAAGNLYIADTDNLVIRKMDTNGIITTVAGDGFYGFSGDGGLATNADMDYLLGVAVDSLGNLFISDTDNQRIRKVDTNGIITTVAGDGRYGDGGDGSAAANASFEYPNGLAVDASDNLFIADQDNSRIRAILVSWPRLSLSPLTLNEAGNYQVIVSSPYGSVTSSVVALTIVIPPSVTLLQPQNPTVVAGTNLTLAVAANGTGPFTYQWHFNNSILGGTDNPDLTLTGVSAANAGTYAVAVSSPYGSVTSEVARLTVLASSSPPAITAEPTNLLGVAGSNVTFNVVVSGTGPFTYQWYDNGQPVAPNITTVAGGSVLDGGFATNGNLLRPFSSAVDAHGNLFVADANNNRIRKVGTNHIITTVAGDGATTYYGDGGAAIYAALYHPRGVALDASGELFIADTYNQRIRKVGANGLITTVAGDGDDGYSGDGGPATLASLYYPCAVAVDAAGNLFIADTDNQRIRKVGTNGIITTVAGDGDDDFYGDGGLATNASLAYPQGVAVDFLGNLFIADTDNQRIRKVGANGIINTVAGNGNFGYSGDGGLALNASLYYPSGVAVDASGNLFIADTDNQRIRKVTNTIISTVAGNGNEGYAGDGGLAANASLYFPSGVTVDASNNLFIADMDNSRIRKVASNAVISTVAGNGSSNALGNGVPWTQAQLNFPSGVAEDASGNILIADTDNNIIRKAGTNGLINTLAGSGSFGYSGDGGVASNAWLSYPSGIAVDGVGDVFFADQNNQRVREVNLANIINTVAGNGGYGFFGDNIALGPNASLAAPSGTAVDAEGNVYIADTDNNRIRRITLNGTIETVAGNGMADFSGDGGAATNACLNEPEGVAVDAKGNLLIADTYNQRIRKVGTNGIISTVAGNGFAGYSGDGGPATGASLNYPQAVALDASSNLFIADTVNNRIRLVSPGGIISSLAGQSTQGFFGDGGPSTNAFLANPAAVAADATGNVLVADSINNRIRQIWRAGLPSLSLSNLNANSAGNYYVVISGPFGSVTTSVATLIILGVPPNITAQPTNLSIGIGSNAAFAVSATSSGTPTYQWQFDGANIPAATNQSYSITGVVAANAGNYDVVVGNAYGSVTSSVASLTVLLPPGIAQQPQSLTVGIGSNATFSVTASGLSPFYYQWSFNGSNIAGAIGSSLTLDGVFPTNAGNYSVSIANPYGHTNSSLAMLNVTLLPLVAPHFVSGGFQFGFTMVPGLDYTLEYSSNLVTWFPFASFSGLSGPIQVVDPEAIGNPHRFYRVVLSH